jgi:hypothetical protein
MPRVVKPYPGHPAVKALMVLHSDIASRQLANKEEAKRLVEDMKHVEAVIRMFDPARDIRPIAVRRRQPNPWFKRGTVFRHALDVMRQAEGPMTAREITLAMLAAAGVTDASPKAVRDLIGSVNSNLQNKRGSTVETIGEGMPVRWRLIQC